MIHLIFAFHRGSPRGGANDLAGVDVCETPTEETLTIWADKLAYDEVHALAIAAPVSLHKLRIAPDGTKTFSTRHFERDPSNSANSQLSTPNSPKDPQP